VFPSTESEYFMLGLVLLQSFVYNVFKTCHIKERGGASVSE